MLLLRQAEGEDPTLLEGLGRPLLDRIVRAHPNRPEAKHRHLPGVPVLKTVETENLRKLANPPRVPARISSPVTLWRAHRREDAFLFDEVEEIRVPNLCVVVVLDAALALALEELDGLEHDLAGSGVRIASAVGLRIEENHGPGVIP